MFFKKSKNSDIEISEVKTGSIIDDIKKNHSRNFWFTISYDLNTTFLSVIKSSFAYFRGVNWKKINEIQVGQIFKTTTAGKTYKLVKFEIDKIYELSTVLEGVQYWMSYEFEKYKQNKTKVNFTQSIYFQTPIGGFKGNIAKMNFAKQFDKNSKNITIQINKFAKEIKDEIQNS